MRDDNICGLVDSLVSSKVCAKLIPRILLDSVKEQRMYAAQVLLKLNMESMFLKRVVTGDQVWINNYEPKSKRSRK